MKLFLTSKFHHVAEDIAPKLSDNQKQNIVFVDTAIKYREFKEGELDWHYANLDAMHKYGYNYELYDIIGKTGREIERDLAKYETIYVEGGNPYYLLQESQKNGFGDYVAKRVKAGMIYISTSAGSVIMGPDIEPVRRAETTPLAPNLKGTIAYGIVPFVIMPHWGNQALRKLYDEYRLKHIYNEAYPYILLTDQQYVEVEGDWLTIMDVSK